MYRGKYVQLGNLASTISSTKCAISNNYEKDKDERNRFKKTTIERHIYSHL